MKKLLLLCAFAAVSCFRIDEKKTIPKPKPKEKKTEQFEMKQPQEICIKGYLYYLFENSLTPVMDDEGSFICDTDYTAIHELCIAGVLHYGVAGNRITVAIKDGLGVSCDF